VNLGANLPAVALILLVFAWVAGSLGVLVGSLIAAEDRVAGICVLASLLMAALGGCWWPLEITPPIYQTIVKVLPSTWAMQGLTDIIVYGKGLNEVWLNAAVLLIFAVIYFVIGVRRLRLD
jgi:ABC-2 type transport system permease protein